MIGLTQIYACGGCGINTGRPWDRNLETDLPKTVLDNIRVAYVDTSTDANLKGDEPAESVYVASGIEGAGKIRRDSHAVFTEENAVKQILVKCPPGALNIVTYSGSGGSGNTIGQLLHVELLKRGERVIALVVGSSENALTMKNTLDSVKTLDVLARRSKAPVVAVFEDNGDNSHRAEVDARIKAKMAALVTLASPGIRELDIADVTNWLRYDKIPGVNIEPQLALLDIITEVEALKEISDPISIASIISDPSETLGGVVPDYSTVGYYADTTQRNQSYHYAISIDAVPRLAAQLGGQLEEIEARRASRKRQQSIAGGDDNVGDDGIVF